MTINEIKNKLENLESVKIGDLTLRLEPDEDADMALDKSKHICTWCDGVIESDQPSVPDITSNDGERQHLGCAVEEADDCGFDGFTQDQG